jgi:hypothetical protein
MNKTKITIALATAAALVVVSFIFVSQQPGSTLATGVYDSCEQLNADFSTGVTSAPDYVNTGEEIENPEVNPSVLQVNAALDEDGDGIACEVLFVQQNSDNWEALAQPLETCQLKETENIAWESSKGFPVMRLNSALGNVRVAVIPVDFKNAPGEGSPDELFADDIQLMKEWAQHFSRGKMSYDIEFNAPTWIRAPKGAEWYTCNQCKGNKKELQSKEKAAQELVAAADDLYDFTGVEMVYFIFPAKAEEEFGTTAYGFNQPIATDEGPITASVYGEMGGVVGARPDRLTVYDHAIHELLHFQGFPGHGPSNWTGHFVTVDQWGPSKAVTSWEAFMAGWFDDEEILCLESKSIQQEMFITMDSIDTFGPGKESVMIRLNKEELIVIERREEGPFTKICPECYSPIEAGFTAYRINVNKPQFRDDNDRNSDEKNFWSFLGSRTDPTITDPVSFKGVTVSLAGKNQVKLTVSN